MNVEFGLEGVLTLVLPIAHAMTGVPFVSNEPVPQLVQFWQRNVHFHVVDPTELAAAMVVMVGPAPHGRGCLPTIGGV